MNLIDKTDNKNEIYGIIYCPYCWEINLVYGIYGEESQTGIINCTKCGQPLNKNFLDRGKLCLI